MPAPDAATLSAELQQALAQADARPLPAALQRPRSLWVPVRWSSLPGLHTDPLHQAWNAWVRSCERNQPTWHKLCRELRPLALASTEEQLRWMVTNLQPYRVSAPDGNLPDGLLTGYYEPTMPASRVRPYASSWLAGAGLARPASRPRPIWICRARYTSCWQSRWQLAGAVTSSCQRVSAAATPSSARLWPLPISSP